MPAYHRVSSRIRPGIELTKIEITLSPFEPPKILMIGRVKTGNRAVDTSSQVKITTAALGPSGAAFIHEMQQQFADRGE